MKQGTQLRLLLIFHLLFILFGSIRAQTIYQKNLQDSLLKFTVNDEEYIDVLNALARSYWNKFPTKTDSIAHISLNLSKKQNYIEGEGSAYHQLAIGQWMLGNYPLAFEYASQELKIGEENELEAIKVNAYSILALITDDQGLIDQSLNYHEKALEGRKARNDSSGVASSLNNLAAVYWRKGDLEESLRLFREAYEIRKAIGNQFGARESLSNIAYVLNEQGKPLEAMPIVKKTRTMALEMNDKPGIINTNETLASIYLNLDQVDSAEQVLLAVLPMAEEMGLNKRIITIKEYLAEVYRRKGDYQRAYSYQASFWKLKDSIEGAEATNQIARLQHQFETQRRETEIIELQQENQKNKIWLLIVALGLIAALVSIYLFVRLYRSRKIKNKALLLAKEQETKQLEAVNQMKSRFLANISHDLRTPLTLILGPTENLLQELKHPEQKQHLSWIQTNAQKLLKLINQLLDLSKIEENKMPLNCSQQDLVQFCRYMSSAFESLAIQKEIQLKTITSQEQLFTYFDANKLEQVLNNLLFNAFKFTEEGQIIIRVDTEEINQQTWAKVMVSDSGIGIHEQQVPYIFDRFFQADQEEATAYIGTGIGLALCKELIELHQGKIKVESKLGKGTTFSILLPLGKEHLRPEEILTTAPTPSMQKVKSSFVHDSLLATNHSDDTLPLVLIVDDNEDMRHFIRMQLGKRFRFILAKNGLKALEIAQEELPDLIISDVMMPGLNGFELCTRIKQDWKSNHIPIILLTARVGEEYKLKGLSHFADEYIQKPFSTNELKARVQNLITGRELLKNRFADHGVFQTLTLAQNPEERTFLKTLEEIIDRYLMDPQLDVALLCQEMKMSKSQLNRKMKAVVGKSPNQYIRSYRLEKAKLLIKTTDFSLSEIAYDVGFSSPAYFSKCFHDEFGYPPSTLGKE